MEERSIDKLRRHHRYNRAVVVSTDNVSAILDTIGMKDDSIYGSRVVESLGCIILYFKNAKLLTSAVTAASRAKIPMFAQTTKTAYKYQIGKDLNASNISKLVKKLGPTIVTLNVSNRNGSEYWAMGTSAKISTADSKSFKLSKVNTDETIFRIAFPGKEKDLYKLVSAVSTQWKVRVVKATLNNKVAYLSINKKEITNNVTETIKVKNQAFKNLSFSAKVAKSIAHRMANVETKISELTTTMSEMKEITFRHVAAAQIFSDDVCCEIISFIDDGKFILLNCCLISKQWLRIIGMYSKLLIEFNDRITKLKSLMESKYLDRIYKIKVGYGVLNQYKFLAVLGKMSQLTKLYISSNFIDDKAAKYFSELKQLTELDISSNTIGINGVYIISQLSHLTFLDIGYNYIGVESKVNWSTEKIKRIKSCFLWNWKGGL